MDMFNKLRSAVSSALPGNPLSKDFDVLNHIASGGPGLVWKIYNAIKKTTKQEAAVFVFEKKLLEKYSRRDKELIVETLKKGISQLTRLRHPKILSVLHPLEESRETLAFATEPVFSCLANVLNKHDNMPTPLPADFKDYKLYEVEIKHGLLQLAEGLAFLHNDVKMVHCNICPESIIINKNGSWKIAGFDCCIPNSNQQSDPSFVNAEPTFPYREWDPDLPSIIQPCLDYLAPEFALTMTCCRGSDMFSIGVLIHAIFNYGKPLYECNNQLSMFKKYSEELRKFRSSLLGNVPVELHEYVKLLLNTEPSVRPDSDQLTKIPYFEDVGSMTLQFMDTLFQRDNLQKSHFFKGLPKIIEKLPKRVNLQRILPALTKECVNADMIPFVLPSILLMAEQVSEKEYMMFIFPELKPMFKIKEPIQILLLFMQNMNLLLKKTPQSEIKNHVLPMIYQALDQNSPQLQEICLNIIPTFAELIDFSSLKSHILPRIKKICLGTSTLKIRVHCLLCVGKLLEYMDKWTVLDDILPFLPQVPSKEPAVLMSILGIYQVTMTHAKLGITKDIMATKVLPFLIPLSIDNNINLSQFNAFFGVIKEMMTKVEQEHRSKLEQLDQMKKEHSVNEEQILQSMKSTVEITQLTGKEQQQLVGNVGQGPQSMMDKFLSGFGMSGLMNSKAGGGGDNSSTASPVDSRSNSPKPPSSSSSQSAKDRVIKSRVLTMEEKQRLAKEQEQQRNFKAQTPLTMTTDKPAQSKQQTTKPTNQVKDLTSSLMNANLRGMQTSPKSVPNYQQMGQSSSNYNANTSVTSNYSAVGQSGNRPNYTGGGMMGNMASSGGQGLGSSRQFGGQGQQTTQKMDLSAFDSLLPTSAQQKPTINQMSSPARQINPSSMNYSPQNSMMGGNLNAYGGNFNTSSNTYGQFQSPGMPNMQTGTMGYTGHNMGGGAMFNNQPINTMTGQNSFGLQPMGSQQFSQTQPTKKLGQSDLDDLLG
ncbi:SCY1-like protein 2 isoform X2 [Mytilus californianus]|uniref:SCY1-like protein 2 isoform X2 n=1 Tax=Mytilus californianus TaxID=6549 RepID=UPI002246E1E0|nr:SCY1-like protein 2 isoform X2 [Mytilus californianus]